MITLNGPKSVTLSPQTCATILDVLAKSGPWNVVDPAMKELMSQLEDKPDEPITDK
jgi:hypothetical protein